MELVEAGVADLDALVERWHALAEEMEAYDELNALADVDIDELAESGFRAHLDDDEVTEYLIVHDGETIGFLTLRENEHPSREYARSLRIVNLAIDEEYRNRGHGTAVVERVEELARERGCDHLKVSCEWENGGARRFYRETGFRPKQVEYAQPLD